MKNICVDACLVIKWLLEEDDSQAAIKLLKELRKNNYQLFAPSILDYEVGTVLRQKLIRNEIKQKHIYPIIQIYHSLDLLLLHITKLTLKASAIAESLNQPTIYDISYLLVSEQQDIDFITADKKFVNAAQNLYPRVKYFTDYKFT